MPVTIHETFGPTRRVGIEQRGSALLALPTEFIGVELELEQPDLNVRGDRLRSWGANRLANMALVATHNDGSLRNGIELVFAQPLFGEAAITAIDAMFEIKQANGLTDSVRTSTHVHINYSDTDVSCAMRALALNAIVEPYIVASAGTHREANCYAVSLSGCRFLSSTSFERAAEGALSSIVEGHRYLGFNITALSKYGTIEYRYFGGLERDAVLGLVNMCLEQKKMALSGQDVRALLEGCATIRDFIFRYLPHHAAFLDLTSVNHEDDIRWRDEALLSLTRYAFNDAFDLSEYEIDVDDGRDDGAEEYTARIEPDALSPEAGLVQRLTRQRLEARSNAIDALSRTVTASVNPTTQGW